MSTPQRIHTPTMVIVDRETADVLRLEAKKAAMFEHDLFGDFLDFCPDAQYGLSLRYRDIFNIIDILSWNPDTVDPAIETYTVPLTEDLINLLALRRHDLATTNVDRLEDAGEIIAPDLLADITTNRLAIRALDHLFGTYAESTKA
jgi:hypothetical protein